MVKKYLSLVKFSHTIFAMPFAMIGFCLGVLATINGTAGATNGLDRGDLLLKFLLVVLCMVFARSAAMAFNRWLDKNFDAKNPRTAIREIPAGIISANKALLFVVINSVLFVVTTAF